MKPSRMHSPIRLLSRAALAAATLAAPAAIAQDAPKDERAQTQCVILLHGLTRSPASMRKLESVLTDRGYAVVNQGYDSRAAGIEDLSGPTIDEALSKCTDENMTVHVVAHSLGGILVRHYLAQKPIERLGRVVMLGPPNQGSEVTDKISDLPGYGWLNGPAGHQLGTDEGSVPASLGPADFDLGIIAGDRSINLILSGMIPDSDDGKVSVERTKLEGMNDHITLPVSHPFLMRNESAISQVLHYLEHGRFDRKNGESVQSEL